MRASARSTVRGGAIVFRRWRISDCCTSARSFGWPGICSSAAPATQTSASPSAAPATQPPIESSSRSGGITDRPPRASEPAALATHWRSEAPTSAPTSPASGV